MRGRSFHSLRIARVAGYIAVAAVIVGVGIHRRPEDTRKAVSLRVPSTTTNALGSELARCQAIGLAAKDDDACEAAWAENRRHFFTYRRADSAVAPRTPSLNPATKPEEQ